MQQSNKHDTFDSSVICSNICKNNFNNINLILIFCLLLMLLLSKIISNIFVITSGYESINNSINF